MEETISAVELFYYTLAKVNPIETVKPKWWVNELWGGLLSTTSLHVYCIVTRTLPAVAEVAAL